MLTHLRQHKLSYFFFLQGFFPDRLSNRVEFFSIKLANTQNVIN